MTIEVIEGLKRKATFSIDKKDVQSSTKIELRKYAKQAKIQGFRPGKVPANIIEQTYGGKAYQDALTEHINRKFFDIITNNKLEIAGYPKFDLTNSDGEELIFNATFEVMPEIVFNDFSRLEIIKPICEVTDETVEKAIDMLRKQRATYIESNKSAADSDRVTIDFVGTVDGVEFDGGKAEDYKFVLGQGTMLADFEAAIRGLRVSESKEVEVNFPENYHADNLKGKKAIFNITVKKIEEQQLPELTEDFIKSIGVSSGDEVTLRKEIKENLAREIKQRLKIKTREETLSALKEYNKIDVPYTMIHDEIHYMMEQARENMKKQGYTEDKIKLTHEMFDLDAKNMVTFRLLVQAFIKQNNIIVSDDEIKDVVNEMAVMYEDPAEYMTWYFTDENRVQKARAIALENKVINEINARAKLTNKEISYEEIMGMQIY